MTSPIRFSPVGRSSHRGMHRLHVPGVAVRFSTGRSITAGFGVTSVEHPLRSTADSSFSRLDHKEFVGTLAMRLVEMASLIWTRRSALFA